MKTPLLLLGAAAFVASQPHAGPLDKLAWLSGCWESRRANSTSLEMWLPPAGNLMMGASRTVAGDKVREYEQFRLTWTGDSLVYHAEPAGQPAADFKGGAPTETGFVVRNPAHDYPTMISYTRRGADSLVARIEGPGPNGTTKGIDYPMKRASCTP